MVLNTLVLTAAGFAALYWRSALPIALGAFMALGLWLLQRHMQPLLGLSQQQMASARKAHGWDLLLAVLFVLWQ